MKSLLLASAIAMTATGAFASELIKVPSNKSVPATIDALEMAVKNAGATVFARVDHAAGATSIGSELSPAEVLIFGNPKLGTPAMEADIRSGLYLPLKVLAYEDETGQVFLTYEDPAEMMSDLDIAADAPFVTGMLGALGKLSAAATQ